MTARCASGYCGLSSPGCSGSLAHQVDVSSHGFQLNLARWRDAASPCSCASRQTCRQVTIRCCSMQASVGATLSATAEALQAICDLDLTELQAIVPPRGFGRD